MIRLVVGLGNPGRKYQNTRHNLGFRVLDLLLKNYRSKMKRGSKTFYFSKVNLEDRELYLVKPDTFMNLSGQAVKDCLNRWDVKKEETLVLCDDLNLPLGSIRIRPEGSDGGNNGLKSIIEELGTGRFPRMRLGIGSNPEGVPAEKYVLQNFRKDEKKTVTKLIQTAAEAVEFTLEEGLEKAMNKYNRGGDI
jgi:PTH1 family peptidyl-tRNA hydrolase